MDVGSIVFMYFIAALIVGIFVLRDVGGEPSYMIKKKDKKLGPSYWGLYQDSVQEDASMVTIEPPKPCKDLDGVAGSATYSKGRAVKSAR